MGLCAGLAWCVPLISVQEFKGQELADQEFLRRPGVSEASGSGGQEF